MRNPELKLYRLAPIPLAPAPPPGPDETLRAEVRAAVKRQMDAIIRDVLAESKEEREVREELAKAGTVALNARAAACYRRLVKNGMDSIKAGQTVLRAVQEVSK